MNVRDKKLVLFGIMAAVVIAAAAPFLASGDPDGLERTADEIEGANEKEKNVHESPLEDYTTPGIDDEGSSGAVSVILGTVITLLIVLTLLYGMILVKRRKKEKSEDNNERD